MTALFVSFNIAAIIWIIALVVFCVRLMLGHTFTISHYVMLAMALLTGVVFSGIITNLILSKIFEEEFREIKAEQKAKKEKRA